MYCVVNLNIVYLHVRIIMGCLKSASLCLLPFIPLNINFFSSKIITDCGEHYIREYETKFIGHIYQHLLIDAY